MILKKENKQEPCFASLKLFIDSSFRRIDSSAYPLLKSFGNNCEENVAIIIFKIIYQQRRFLLVFIGRCSIFNEIYNTDEINVAAKLAHNLPHSN
jgi:hypothetical protein